MAPDCLAAPVVLDYPADRVALGCPAVLAAQVCQVDLASPVDLAVLDFPVVLPVPDCPVALALPVAWPGIEGSWGVALDYQAVPGLLEAQVVVRQVSWAGQPPPADRACLECLELVTTHRKRSHWGQTITSRL